MKAALEYFTAILENEAMTSQEITEMEGRLEDVNGQLILMKIFVKEQKSKFCGRTLLKESNELFFSSSHIF